jgi:hypothetical protein
VVVVVQEPLVEMQTQQIMMGVTAELAPSLQLLESRPTMPVAVEEVPTTGVLVQLLALAGWAVAVAVARVMEA